MKRSDELRRETYRQLIDWRIECNKLKLTPLPTNVNGIVGYVSFAASQRLLNAYEPIFARLTRIETLLAALKYIAVFMVLCSSCQGREYRHVKHHHSQSVDRSVRIYDPPRVELHEVRPIKSVFEAGFYAIDFRFFDTSFMLDVYHEPVAFDPPPTPPAFLTVEKPQNPFDVAHILIAGGIGMLLCAFGRLMTGPYDSDTPPAWLVIQRRRSWTLVERRWWLPETISLGWLHLKHYLGLR